MGDNWHDRLCEAQMSNEHKREQDEDDDISTPNKHNCTNINRIREHTEISDTQIVPEHTQQWI